MKSTTSLGACLGFLLIATTLLGQPLTLPEVSPKASVMQTIGVTQVTVTYSRPSVGKREIWGKLVPYGFNDLGFGTAKAAPWRAGANENTLISLQHDATVAGSPLKAGTYALFMAVAQDGTVTLIFSRDTSSWGSYFYDEARDALRVPVKWVDGPFTEQLTYDFSGVTNDSAVLALSWETKRIPIPLKVDTTANTVALLKDELRSAKGFTHEAWVNASKYLLTHNLDLNLALEWADTALTARFVGQKNYLTLFNKGQILEKLGRAAEAKPLIDEALALADISQIHQYGRELLAQGNSTRALEVFKLNAERHPDVWPVNYGLARGFSAVGDYPAALAAILKAQTQIPPGDSVNANAIQVNIEKLKRGENIN